MNRFDVNIAGYTLTVNTERPAERVERICELLNEQVREVQRSGATTNYLHALLLAAMKLADEVLELQGERAGDKRKLEEKSRELLAALDEALK